MAQVLRSRSRSPSSAQSNSGEPSLVLTDEHHKALKWFAEGRNLLITGSAGTGKSKLLEKLVEDLEGMYLACGPTGMSALSLLNGTGETLHRTFFIPISTMPKETMQSYYWRLKRSYDNPVVQERIDKINKISVLIVDEISMVSTYMLEVLDVALRTLRDRLDSPLGGVQFVAVGDFLQLPPVYNAKDPQQNPDQGKMAFESPVWAALQIQTVTLTKIFRQQEDLAFATMLNRIRKGETVKGDDISRMTTMMKRTPDPDALSICFRNDAVKSINANHYARLQKRMDPSEEHTYPMPLAEVDNSMAYVEAMETQRGSGDFFDLCQKRVQEDLNFLKTTTALCADSPGRQTFLPGTSVMLVRNLPDLCKVNGSRGIVVTFASLPCEEGCSEQKPCLVCGLPDHLDKTFPVVHFDDGRTHTIGPCRYSREAILPDGTKFTTCQVVCIPLIRAWAISAHRSQGITLARNVPVHIDAKNMNTVIGAFYVALSRCSCMDQVAISNFSGFFGSHLARRFYDGTYVSPPAKTYTDSQNYEALSNDKIFADLDEFKHELSLSSNFAEESATEWMKRRISGSGMTFTDLDHEWTRTMEPLLVQFFAKFSTLRASKRRKGECAKKMEAFVQRNK